MAAGVIVDIGFRANTRDIIKETEKALKQTEKSIKSSGADSAVQEQIDNIRSEILKLNEQLGHLYDGISNNTVDEFGSLESKMKSVQNRMSEMKTSITTLQSVINGLGQNGAENILNNFEKLEKTVNGTNEVVSKLLEATGANGIDIKFSNANDLKHFKAQYEFLVKALKDIETFESNSRSVNFERYREMLPNDLVSEAKALKQTIEDLTDIRLQLFDNDDISGVAKATSKLVELGKSYRDIQNVYYRKHGTLDDGNFLDTIVGDLNIAKDDVNEYLNKLKVDIDKMSIRKDIEDAVSNIGVTKFELNGGKLLVPVDLDQEDINSLYVKLNSVIIKLQEKYTNEPIKIGISFVSGLKSNAKEEIEEYKKLKESIANDESIDKDIKGSLNSLFNNLDRSLSKSLFQAISNELNESVKFIKRTLNEEFEIHPAIKWDNDSREKAKEQIDKLAQDIDPTGTKTLLKLTPSEMSSLKKNVQDLTENMTKMFDTGGIILWKEEFINALNTIGEKLNEVSSKGELFTMFDKWTDADNVMFKNDPSSMSERSALLNSITGKVYGEYTYDKHSSTNMNSFIDTKGNNVNTAIHSHANLKRATMSTIIASDGEYNGDLLNALATFKNGITRQVIKAIDEVAIFDTEDFVKKNKSKLKLFEDQFKLQEYTEKYNNAIDNLSSGHIEEYIPYVFSKTGTKINIEDIIKKMFFNDKSTYEIFKGKFDNISSSNITNGLEKDGLKYVINTAFSGLNNTSEDIISKSDFARKFKETFLKILPDGPDNYLQIAMRKIQNDLMDDVFGIKNFEKYTKTYSNEEFRIKNPLNLPTKSLADYFNIDDSIITKLQTISDIFSNNLTINENSFKPLISVIEDIVELLEKANGIMSENHLNIMFEDMKYSMSKIGTGKGFANRVNPIYEQYKKYKQMGGQQNFIDLSDDQKKKDSLVAYISRKKIDEKKDIAQSNDISIKGNGVFTIDTSNINVGSAIINVENGTISSLSNEVINNSLLDIDKNEKYKDLNLNEVGFSNEEFNALTIAEKDELLKLYEDLKELNEIKEDVVANKKSTTQNNSKDINKDNTKNENKRKNINNAKQTVEKKQTKSESKSKTSTNNINETKNPAISNVVQQELKNLLGDATVKQTNKQTIQPKGSISSTVSKALKDTLIPISGKNAKIDTDNIVSQIFSDDKITTQIKEENLELEKQKSILDEILNLSNNKGKKLSQQKFIDAVGFDKFESMYKKYKEQEGDNALTQDEILSNMFGTAKVVKQKYLEYQNRKTKDTKNNNIKEKAETELKQVEIKEKKILLSEVEQKKQNINNRLALLKQTAKSRISESLITNINDSGLVVNQEEITPEKISDTSQKIENDKVEIIKTNNEIEEVKESEEEILQRLKEQKYKELQEEKERLQALSREDKIKDTANFNIYTETEPGSGLLRNMDDVPDVIQDIFEEIEKYQKNPNIVPKSKFVSSSRISQKGNKRLGKTDSGYVADALDELSSLIENRTHGEESDNLIINALLKVAARANVVNGGSVNGSVKRSILNKIGANKNLKSTFSLFGEDNGTISLYDFIQEMISNGNGENTNSAGSGKTTKDSINSMSENLMKLFGINFGNYFKDGESFIDEFQKQLKIADEEYLNQNKYLENAIKSLKSFIEQTDLKKGTEEYTKKLSKLLSDVFAISSKINGGEFGDSVENIFKSNGVDALFEQSKRASLSYKKTGNVKGKLFGIDLSSEQFTNTFKESLDNAEKILQDSYDGKIIPSKRGLQDIINRVRSSRTKSGNYDKELLRDLAAYFYEWRKGDKRSILNEMVYGDIDSILYGSTVYQKTTEHRIKSSSAIGNIATKLFGKENEDNYSDSLWELVSLFKKKNESLNTIDSLNLNKVLTNEQKNLKDNKQKELVDIEEKIKSIVDELSKYNSIISPDGLYKELTYVMQRSNKHRVNDGIVNKNTNEIQKLFNNVDESKYDFQFEKIVELVKYRNNTNAKSELDKINQELSGRINSLKKITKNTDNDNFENELYPLVDEFIKIQNLYTQRQQMGEIANEIWNQVTEILREAKSFQGNNPDFDPMKVDKQITDALRKSGIDISKADSKIKSSFKKGWQTGNAKKAFRSLSDSLTGNKRQNAKIKSELFSEDVAENYAKKEFSRIQFENRETVSVEEAHRRYGNKSSEQAIENKKSLSSTEEKIETQFENQLTSYEQLKNRIKNGYYNAYTDAKSLLEKLASDSVKTGKFSGKDILSLINEGVFNGKEISPLINSLNKEEVLNNGEIKEVITGLLGKKNKNYNVFTDSSLYDSQIKNGELIDSDVLLTKLQNNYKKIMSYYLDKFLSTLPVEEQTVVPEETFDDQSSLWKDERFKFKLPKSQKSKINTKIRQTILPVTKEKKDFIKQEVDAEATKTANETSDAINKEGVSAEKNAPNFDILTKAKQDFVEKNIDAYDTAITTAKGILTEGESADKVANSFKVISDAMSLMSEKSSGSSNMFEFINSLKTNSEVFKKRNDVKKLENFIETLQMIFEKLDKIQLSDSTLSIVSTFKNFLSSLNSAISNLGKEKDVEKIDQLINNLTLLFEKLNKLDLKENASIKAFNDLLSHSDEIRTIGKILESPNFKNAEKIKKYDDAKELIKNNSDLIIKQSDSFIKENNKDITLIGANTITATKEGLIEITTLAKDVNDNIVKFITTTSDGSIITQKSFEQGTTYLLKQEKLYEKLRNISDKNNVKNVTTNGFINIDIGSDKSKEIIDYLKQYEDILGNIISIQRQVRQDQNGNLLESFRVNGDKASITLGDELEVVASAQKILDNDKFTKQNNDAADAYDKLYKNALKYYQLLEKYKNGKISLPESAILSNIQKEVNDAINGTGKYSISNNGTSLSYDKALNKRDMFFNNNKDTYTEYTVSNLNKSKEKTESLLSNQSTYINKYVKELNEARECIDAIEEILSNINKNNGIIDENDIRNISILNSKIEETISLANNKSVQKAKNTAVSKLVGNISDTINKNSAADKEYLTLLNNLRNEIRNYQGDIDKVTFDKWAEQFHEINAQIKESGNVGRGMLDRITASAKARFAQFWSYYFSMMDIIRYTRQAYETIKDLDTALIDLKKTTTMSGSELNDFYLDASDSAKKLGVTTKEVIEQAAEWSRLGYSDKVSATTMAELSSQFATISPGMDTNTATSGLVSIMKAFSYQADQVETEIMDKINIVGNSFAVTNADIVTGLEKSSTAMNAANNSFEETVALFTAGNEILQNAESMGTALRTISMRIRGYDEETEELSEDYENISGVIADLTKTEDTPGGISLFTDSTKETYKSTYEVLKEISKIWDKLSDKQQANLLEKLFGKTRAQAGAAMLSNFSQAENAIKTMGESLGSSDKELDNIQQSISFKINAIKQDWVGLLQTFADRESFISVLSVLLDLSETLTDVLTAAGPFVTLFAGGSASLGALYGIGKLFGSKTLMNPAANVFGGLAKDFGIEQAIEQYNKLKVVGVKTGDAIKSAFTTAFTSINPVTYVIIGLTAAFVAYNAAVTTAEEAQRKYNKTSEEFESNKQEIENVNSELQKTQNRMNELESMNSLTFVEENELSNLKQTNEQLERKKRLLTDLNKTLSKQKINDQLGVLESRYGMNNIFGQDIWKISDEFNPNDKGSLSFELARYKKLKDNLNNPNNTLKKQENIEKSYNDSEKMIAQAILDFDETLQALDEIGYENLPMYQQELYDTIDYNLNALLKEYNYGEWKERNYEDLVTMFSTKSNYKNDWSILKGKIDSGTIISKDDIPNSVKEYLSSGENDTEIDIDNFVERLLADYGLYDYDSIRNQLLDSLNKNNSIKTVNKEISKEEFNLQSDEIQKWIDGLTEEQLEIVFKIRSEIDTSDWNKNEWIEEFDKELNKSNKKDDVSKTFSEIFSDEKKDPETFTAWIDEYQSQLSSLSSTISELNEKGKIDPGKLTDLVQEFPELEQYTNDVDELGNALASVTFDELIKSFEKIDNKLSESHPEWAKNIKKDFVDAINFAEIDTSNFRDNIFDIFNTEIGSSSFYSYNQNRNKLLSEYGNTQEGQAALSEFYVQVKAGLIPDEVLSNWDSIQNYIESNILHVGIQFDQKDLADIQNKINLLSSEKAVIQAELDLKVQRGEVLTKSDYDDLVHNSAVDVAMKGSAYRTAQKTYDDMLASGEYKSDSEELTKARNDAIKAQSDLIQSQEELDKNVDKRNNADVESFKKQLAEQEKLTSLEKANLEYRKENNEVLNNVDYEPLVKNATKELELQRKIIDDYENRIDLGETLNDEDYSSYVDAQQSSIEKQNALNDIINGMHQDTVSSVQKQIDHQKELYDLEQQKLDAKREQGKATEDDYLKQEESINSQIDLQRQLIATTKAISDLDPNNPEKLSAYINAQSTLLSLEQDLLNTEKERLSLPIEKLTEDLEVIQDQASDINNIISTKQARGLKRQDKQYKALIKNSAAQIKNYSQQNKLIEQQLKNLSEEDPLYRERQKSLNANKQAMRELINQQMEYLYALQETQQSQSALMAEYDHAQQSSNPSDSYNSVYSGLEGAKKLFDQGWYTKDDFTTFAMMISKNGESLEEAIQNFSTNYANASKYFTEDGKGLDLFVSKMKELGYVTGDAENGWELNIDDLYELADAMNLSTESTSYLLEALNDRGWNIDIDHISKNFGKNFEDIWDHIHEGSEGIDQDFRALFRNMEFLGENADDLSDFKKESYLSRAGSALQGAFDEGMFNEDELLAYQSMLTSIASEWGYIGTITENGMEFKVMADVVENSSLNPQDVIADIQQQFTDENGTITLELTPEITDLDKDGIEQKLKEIQELRDSLANGTARKTDENGNQIEYSEEERAIAIGELDSIISSLTKSLDAYDLIQQQDAMRSAVEEGMKTGIEDNTSSLDSNTEAINALTSALGGDETQQNTVTEQQPVYPLVDQQQQTISSSINLPSKEEVANALNGDFRVNVYATGLSELTSDVENAVPDQENVEIVSSSSIETDTSNSVEQLQSVVEAESQIEENKEINVDASSAVSSTNMVNNLSFAINLVKDKSVNIVANGAQSSANSVNNLADAINRLHDKEITIRTNRVSGGKSTDAEGTFGLASGTLTFAHANGTSVALKRNETSLVNEEGNESIVRNGVWSIIPGGAHVESLKKGDIIFSKTQTDELIKHGKVTSGGGTGRTVGMKAHASGTAINGMPAHASYGVNAGVTGKTWNIPLVNEGIAKMNAYTESINQVASAAKKGKKGLDKFKDLFDFIEIRIQRLQDQINLYTTQAENRFNEYTSLLNKGVNRKDIYPGKAINARNSVGTGVNDYIDQSIELTKNAINANNKGAKKYASKAGEILGNARKTIGTKKANTIAEKIRKGAIDISTLKGKSKEFADLYKTYYDKAKQAAQTTVELQASLTELAQTKLDNITREFEAFNTIATHSNDLINDFIKLRETQGFVESENYYNTMITNQEKNISDLKNQRDQMQRELNASVKNGEVVYGSTKWREMQNEINEVNNSIIQSETTLAEYNRKLEEIIRSRFDSIVEEIDRVVSASETVVDVLSFKDLIDKDTAKYTKEGIATLSLYSQEYELARQKANEYAKELKRLDDQYENNQTDTWYVEQRKGLESSYQESLKSTKSFYQNMRDLSQQWVDAQVDHMNKMIKKYEDALDAEKNLYDYQKSVKDQTDAITNLRKQLSVAQMNNSEEGRLKTAKLQKQLDDAEKSLKESQNDKMIENQKEMFDNLSGDYEEALNKQLKDFEAYYNTVVVPEINTSGEEIEDTMKENISTLLGTESTDLSTLNKNFSSTWENYSIELSNSTNKLINHIDKISDALIGTDGHSILNGLQSLKEQQDEGIERANNQATKDLQQVGTEEKPAYVKVVDPKGLKDTVTEEQLNKAKADRDAALGGKSLSTLKSTRDSAKTKMDSAKKALDKAKAAYKKNPTKANKNKLKTAQTKYDNAKKAYNNANTTYNNANTLNNTYTNLKSTYDEQQAYKNSATSYEENPTGSNDGLGLADSYDPRLGKQNPQGNSNDSDNNSNKNESSKGNGKIDKGDTVTTKSDINVYKKDGKTNFTFERNGKKVHTILKGYKFDIIGSQKINGEKWWHLKYNGKDRGWIKESVLKNKTKGYATGTKKAKEDLAWTQEQGGELIRRSDGALLTPVKGSTIFNAEMTDRLWNFASNPNNFMDQIAKGMANAFATNVPTNNVVSTNVDNHNNQFIFNLENVNDYESFMQQAQKDKKFEQLIQNMTVGQLNGKTSLSKNRIKF